MTGKSRHELPTIRVSDSLTLKVMSPDMVDEAYTLIVDNLDYLKLWVYWAMNGMPSRESLLNDFASNVDRASEGSALIMGITQGSHLIGMVNVSNIKKGTAAELGYWLAKDYVGRGIATVCAEKLINFVHKVYGITEFTINTITGNKPSIALAERLGFEMRESAFNSSHGTIENHYSLLIADKD